MDCYELAAIKAIIEAQRKHIQLRAALERIAEEGEAHSKSIAFKALTPWEEEG